MDTYSKIANYLAGMANEADKAELDAWRKSDPANEEEFLKLQKIWQLAPPSPSFTPNVEKAWEKVSTCLFQTKGLVSAKSKKDRVFPITQKRMWPMAAAVSLLFLVALGFFFYNNISDTISSSKLAVLKTTALEKQQVILADGTQIWLNSQSSLQYPEAFTSHLREVFLTGEAYFEVTPMPEKPFIIHAGAGKVEVLGTAFSLYTNQNEKVKLQVVQGLVKLSLQENSGQAIEIGAGEAAEILGREIKSVEAGINTLSWQTGEFVFEETSLEEVFRTLESYYPVKFNAKDAKILSCRLSARFKQQSLDEVLEVLSLTLNLKHIFSDNNAKVTFSSSGSGPHCADVNF